MVRKKAGGKNPGSMPKVAQRRAGVGNPGSLPKDPATPAIQTSQLAELLAKTISGNSELQAQLISQLDLTAAANASSNVQKGEMPKHKMDKGTKSSKNGTSNKGKLAGTKNKLNKRLSSKTVSSISDPDSSDESDSQTNEGKGKQKRKKSPTNKVTKPKKRKLKTLSMSSDDDDSDSSMDLGSEDQLDINSILNSDDGESDSDNNDLADLGLLSELLNEEVTDKWKKKIWQRQFIDFHKLYYGKDDSHVEMVVRKTKSNATTSVSKKPQRKITNILSWSRAFQLYASIYCIKYPDEASGMFQYMTLIQTMAKKSPNWQTYDIKFRKLRKHRPLPWSKLHLRAHVYSSLAVVPKGNSQNNSGGFRPNGNNFRPSGQTPNRIFKKGYCWEFQRLGKCTRKPCNRTHKCSLCEGPHGGTSCPNNTKPNMPSNGPGANRQQGNPSHTPNTS